MCMCNKEVIVTTWVNPLDESLEVSNLLLLKSSQSTNPAPPSTIMCKLVVIASPFKKENKFGTVLSQLLSLLLETRQSLDKSYLCANITRKTSLPSNSNFNLSLVKNLSSLVIPSHLNTQFPVCFSPASVSKRTLAFPYEEGRIMGNLSFDYILKQASLLQRSSLRQRDGYSLS